MDLSIDNVHIRVKWAAHKYHKRAGYTFLREKRRGIETPIICGRHMWAVSPERSEIICSRERGIAAGRLMKLCDRHCVSLALD